MKLEKEALLQIRGGSITPTMINAIVRALDLIVDLGRSLGSAIRRTRDGNECSY